ncbi:MAG: hypothetical protein ACLQU1_14030 [Bryobacteraceae bacterium]
MSKWLGLLICPVLWGGATGRPESWVVARWQGGPLEVAWRAKAKTLPADAAARDAIAHWYDESTLALVDGTPINCLVVTWSAGADPVIERQQQEIVGNYARRAHARGLAVLGLVLSGADPAIFASPAAAGLDGLVMELAGAPPPAKSGASLVVPLGDRPAPLRAANGPVVAIRGVPPRSRLLTEMGIAATPSSQPWIDSNMWLVRSFHAGADRRMVWLGYLPEEGTRSDGYARAVADAAIPGGRWMAAPDDALRAGLFRRQPAALETWRRMAAYLKFYEDHGEWRDFAPAGLLGMVLDNASRDPAMADEYRNLVARRQVPYRLIERSQLSADSLKGLQAVMAMDLAPPSDAERKLLRGFAEGGGVVVAGHTWGGEVPKGQPYAEIPSGKGRMVVYADDQPGPEAVSKDLPDLLDDLGVRVFNTPSVLTYASADGSGKRLLVQMLDYADFPAESMTVQVESGYRTARLYTPENGVTELAVKAVQGKSEVSIPRLVVAGALLLEK